MTDFENRAVMSCRLGWFRGKILAMFRQTNPPLKMIAVVEITYPYLPHTLFATLRSLPAHLSVPDVL